MASFAPPTTITTAFPLGFFAADDFTRNKFFSTLLRVTEFIPNAINTSLVNGKKKLTDNVNNLTSIPGNAFAKPVA